MALLSLVSIPSSSPAGGTTAAQALPGVASPQTAPVGATEASAAFQPLLASLTLSGGQAATSAGALPLPGSAAPVPALPESGNPLPASGEALPMPMPVLPQLAGQPAGTKSEIATGGENGNRADAETDAALPMDWLPLGVTAAQLPPGNGGGNGSRPVAVPVAVSKATGTTTASAIPNGSPRLTGASVAMTTEPGAAETDVPSAPSVAGMSTAWLERGRTGAASPSPAAADAAKSLAAATGTPLQPAGPSASIAAANVPAATIAADDSSFAAIAEAILDPAAGVETGEQPSVQQARETPRPYAAQPANTQVAVPFGKPGWSEAVAEKVMWFTAQHINSVEIQLSPPELGPLQVRVSTQHEQASVYFASHHAAVRDALDQALPRLRELFEGQGIQLADAGVGERNFSGERAFHRDNGGNSQARGGDGDHGEASLDAGDVPMASLRGTGLVDAYA